MQSSTTATVTEGERQRFNDAAIRHSKSRGESFTFACTICSGTVIGKKSLLSDDIRANCSGCGHSAHIK